MILADVALSAAIAGPLHINTRRALFLQDDTLQQELEEMARTSPDGVVHLNTEQFDKFVVGKRRPYAIILFMTASHLLDKASLDLRGLRKEFGLLSKACAVTAGCRLPCCSAS